MSDGAHAGHKYVSTGAKNDIALPQVAGFVHYLVQSNTRKMKKALIIKGFFHSLGGEGGNLPLFYKIVNNQQVIKHRHYVLCRPVV